MSCVLHAVLRLLIHFRCLPPPPQTDFFDPNAKGSKGAAVEGLAALLGPAECVAAEAAAQLMLEVQSSAGESTEGLSCWCV